MDRRPKNPFIVTLFACALIADAGRSAAWAEGSSKSHGEGGHVPDFLEILRQYNASGEPFRIEGTCKSACTMFLGIRNACLERNATLMFHAGRDIKENITGPNTPASRTLMSRLSPQLRRYLLGGHYMDTDAYHSLSGGTLIDTFGYRECPPK
jgi:hypothetical protein